MFSLIVYDSMQDVAGWYLFLPAERCWFDPEHLQYFCTGSLELPNPFPKCHGSDCTVSHFG